MLAMTATIYFLVLRTHGLTHMYRKVPTIEVSMVFIILSDLATEEAETVWEEGLSVQHRTEVPHTHKTKHTRKGGMQAPGCGLRTLHKK